MIMFGYMIKSGDLIMDHSGEDYASRRQKKTSVNNEEGREGLDEENKGSGPSKASILCAPENARNQFPSE